MMAYRFALTIWLPSRLAAVFYTTSTTATATTTPPLQITIVRKIINSYTTNVVQYTAQIWYGRRVRCAGNDTDVANSRVVDLYETPTFAV